VKNKVLNQRKFNALSEHKLFERKLNMEILQSKASLEHTKLNAEVWRTVCNQRSFYTDEQYNQFITLIHRVAEAEWGIGTVVEFDYQNKTIKVSNGDREITI
jgi:hypothetical protein